MSEVIDSHGSHNQKKHGRKKSGGGGHVKRIGGTKNRTPKKQKGSKVRVASRNRAHLKGSKVPVAVRKKAIAAKRSRLKRQAQNKVRKVRLPG